MLGWYYLGWLYHQLGAGSRAVQAARSGIKSAEQFPPLKLLSGTILLRQAIRERDRETAREWTTALGRPGGMRMLLINDLVVELAASAGLLFEGETALAQEHVDEMLRRMRDAGIRYFLPYVLHLRAQVLREQGRPDETRACLEDARLAAEAIGNRILLWRILAELGETEAAWETVRYIAGQISEPELRAEFEAFAGARIR